MQCSYHFCTDQCMHMEVDLCFRCYGPAPQPRDQDARIEITSLRVSPTGAIAKDGRWVAPPDTPPPQNTPISSSLLVQPDSNQTSLGSGNVPLAKIVCQWCKNL